MTCARGCTLFRKHLKSCPVSDGSNGAWVPWTATDDQADGLPVQMIRDEVIQAACDGDQRHPFAGQVRTTSQGQLETYNACNGCLPRDAKHGSLCESCHVRLEQWLHGEVHVRTFIPDRKHPRYWPATTLALRKWSPSVGVLVWHTLPITERSWIPDTGSIAWAYDWLSEDRVPTQMMGAFDKIKTGKKAPPAALNLMIHDLRQDLAQALGRFVSEICNEFGLYGPEWWRHRMDEARRQQEARSRDAYAPYAETDWRAWLPQTSAEVIDAQRYLLNWLDRIESVPDVAVSIYDTANELIKKVAGVAPWEPKPRRLGREVVCPECERPALAIFEGQTSVTCMRCDAVWGRDKYDLWAEVIRSEKVAV